MTAILRKYRRALSEAVDAALVAAAVSLAFLLRFEFVVPADARHMWLMGAAICVVAKLITFRFFGLRDLAWGHVGFEDLARLTFANLTASAVSGTAIFFTFAGTFPRSIYVLDLVLSMVLLSGARAIVRMLSHWRHRGLFASTTRKRILIYGAGRAGRTLVAELRTHPKLPYCAVGFLDDDPAKAGLRLQGLRVLGNRAGLPALVRRHRIDEVLVALPAATGAQIGEILEACHAARVATRRVPRLAELIENKVLVDQIREVHLEDLLGRPEVGHKESGIRAQIEGRTVLVTGAAGSIGSELCRQIARYRPAVMVGFDLAETPLYEIDQEMRESHPYVEFRPEIGSIGNRQRIDEVFAKYRPEVVYHAAAYKHVPMMEAQPFEAIENNIFGTRNVARAAAAAGAGSFILVSSDKAVRPANIMGATKRLAELVCLAANEASVQNDTGRPGGHTRFSAVRFGNVLGSNGSVIPLFQRQIAAGGPVTVTHPEMRRYFMTIPEAARLVLDAGAMGHGGEIFVLEMGEQVRIVDIARKLVLLSGLRPDDDIRIEFTGVRPGEKLSEELNSCDEQMRSTEHSQINIFLSPSVPSAELHRALEGLRRAAELRDGAGIILCLKELIPDYNPSSFVLRRALHRDARGAEARNAASA
ncbi:MAG: nucleoside-diphosphate sugar epimerase/dehydratase [Bryobacteraceae bacterium]